MRVVVPFVPGMLWPQTEAAARAYRPDPDLVELPAESPGAYALCLSAVSRWGEDVAILEQDVAPHGGALAELERCPEPWCAFPYSIEPTTRACLGCSRFRAELFAASPGVFDDLGPWRFLDLEVEARLRAAGYPHPHLHQPAVLHLRARPTSAAALAVRGRIAAATARAITARAPRQA